MDIYALTRKRRPSRLTMAQTLNDRSPSSTNSEPENSERFTLIVTGPPTKDHWKFDEDATSCAYPGCSRIFGLFERKHHCRKCGDIFCNTHCSNYLRLNQDSEFHPQGFLSRGCDDCADKWRHPSLTSTTSTSSTSTEATDEKLEDEQQKVKSKPNRHAGIMTTLQPHALEGVLELGRDDIVDQDDDQNDDDSESSGVDIGSKKVEGTFNTVALSVPADWHWSTF
ncbi:hypothetical protein BCR42DRAFT_417745 [Absidia repens]|uniref:FYVE-type domain-containing protein n=1 Tax=Absidia repens TaxID=90262 RepID=A0A1X2ICE7_9FUNG|nr:hypothetical protein BCR42DRAFT_417745 [Absidia repens]